MMMLNNFIRGFLGGFLLNALFEYLYPDTEVGGSDCLMDRTYHQYGAIIEEYVVGLTLVVVVTTLIFEL